MDGIYSALHASLAFSIENDIAFEWTSRRSQLYMDTYAPRTIDRSIAMDRQRQWISETR